MCHNSHCQSTGNRDDLEVHQQRAEKAITHEPVSTMKGQSRQLPVLCDAATCHLHNLQFEKKWIWLGLVADLWIQCQAEVGADGCNERQHRHVSLHKQSAIA